MVVLALEIGIATSEIWKVYTKGSHVMDFGYQSKRKVHGGQVLVRNFCDLQSKSSSHQEGPLMRRDRAHGGVDDVILNADFIGLPH